MMHMHTEALCCLLFQWNKRPSCPSTDLQMASIGQRRDMDSRGMMSKGDMAAFSSPGQRGYFFGMELKSPASRPICLLSFFLSFGHPFGVNTPWPIHSVSMMCCSSRWKGPMHPRFLALISWLLSVLASWQIRIRPAACGKLSSSPESSY
jgi:hypothetical protein